MYPVKTGADFMANGGKEKVKANIILEHLSPLYFGSKSAHCTHCGEMFKIGKFTVLNCYKLNQKSLNILPEELLCSSCKINKSEEEWDLLNKTNPDPPPREEPEEDESDIREPTAAMIANLEYDINHLWATKRKGMTQTEALNILQTCVDACERSKEAAREAESAVYCGIIRVGKQTTQPIRAKRRLHQKNRSRSSSKHT